MLAAPHLPLGSALLAFCPRWIVVILTIQLSYGLNGTIGWLEFGVVDGGWCIGGGHAQESSYTPVGGWAIWITTKKS